MMYKFNYQNMYNNLIWIQHIGHIMYYSNNNQLYNQYMYQHQNKMNNFKQKNMFYKQMNHYHNKFLKHTFNIQMMMKMLYFNLMIMMIFNMVHMFHLNHNHHYIFYKLFINFNKNILNNLLFLDYNFYMYLHKQIN